MNPKKWKQIDQLFDEVLDLPEKERLKFISERCADDEEIKFELQSLLKAHEKAENFIEDSAIRVMTDRFAETIEFDQNNSLLGRKIGTYKIEKQIGEGGMGQVYLALDEKLKRKVALKVLPSHYMENEERVRRMTLEARAISALNHPNIVTIHDVGEIDSTYFITTEFVEGKTLRDKINEKIKIGESLSLIIQCCNALSAAHQAGVIHRDIKPENIMIREDGYVKILDFGLAKLTEQVDQDSIGMIQTMKGTIMGTPAYMSPEQASGSKVDNRTDLWSIAVVLYELITGINPFKKSNRQETIQAILREEPPNPAKFNSNIPMELNVILQKALEKDADLSYQTASDLIADLKRVKREIDTSSLRTNSLNSIPFNKPISKIPVFIGLGVLILTGMFLGYLYLYQQNNINKPDWTKAQSIRLTNQPGTEFFPSISPDGESFVYAANITGNYDIYLRRISGMKPINLTENYPGRDSQPAFSPDGKLIAFRSENNGGGIYLMGVTGENKRRVSKVGYNPSWSPDSKKLVVASSLTIRPSVRTKSDILIIDVETGEKQKLVGDHCFQPSWSPNGKRIAFWSHGDDNNKRTISTISVEGGNPQIVTDKASTSWNPIWSPDGRFLYFASNQRGYMAIWRIQIDENSGKTIGEEEIVPTPGKYNRHFSFSKDGKKLIYVQLNNQANLKAVKFNPINEKPIDDPFWITTGDQEVIRPRISPDGKRFAVNLIRQTQDDIGLIDLTGENWRELTNDSFTDRYPIWTPDGEKIVFYSDRDGSPQIWMMNSDGSNLKQISNENEQIGFPILSPDGKKLTYRFANNYQHIIKNLSDLKNKKVRKLTNFSEFSFSVWDWSPDGQKLLGRWRNYVDGKFGVGYYNLDTDKYEKVMEGSTTMPRWLPDSRRVIFSYQGKLHLFNTETRKLLQIPNIPDEDLVGVGISREANLLYYVVNQSESNIWLLDLDGK